MDLCCALCWHEYERHELTKHHTVPKSRGGKETVLLCRACHQQVHAVFSEKELERDYGTLELLSAADELQPFLAFIRKRKPTKRINVKTSRRRRRR